jgi:integrase
MYSIKEASLILGLSVPAVKKKIYSGKLKAHKVIGYNRRPTWVVELPDVHIYSLIDEWLDDMEAGRGFNRRFSSKTVVPRKWHMVALWKYSELKPCMTHFNKIAVERAFDKLNQSGLCRFSTKDGILKAYRSFATWLIAKDLKSNELLQGLEDLKPKRFTPPKRSKLKSHEMRLLLEAIDGYNSTAYHKERMMLLLCLISTTGLRISEALSLQVEDLDFENACLKVLGKRQKPRITVMPESLNQALTAWLGVHHQKGKSLFNGWTYNGALIALRRMLKSTQLDIGFHGLRRTCATYWVEQGTPITMVSKLLGHSCIKTTQLYVEADALDAVRYVNALANHLVM